MYYMLVNSCAVIWYYFSYTFLYNTLSVSNSMLLIAGASVGSLFSGIILDLSDNRKVRTVYYIVNVLCTALVWLKHSPYWLFLFGLSFAIGITDFIKYICENYSNKVSLLVNVIAGSVILIIAVISNYWGPLIGKYLSKYLILHGLITTLNLVSIVLFTNDKKEKKTMPIIKEYFSEAFRIFTDKKLIFYYLFLIVNTMSVVTGSIFFIYPKNIMFLRIGIACASLLYYFVLPKLNMDLTTIFMMIFFNLLIYFKLFSPAALIVGHMLFGVCISSIFLSFIYTLRYSKHIGMFFGILHFTILIINILFRKFLMFSFSGLFLTKDLHVVLLQVNKKIIIHFYGYHIPIIIMTIFTLIYYSIMRNSKNFKNKIA